MELFRKLFESNSPLPKERGDLGARENKWSTRWLEPDLLNGRKRAGEEPSDAPVTQGGQKVEDVTQNG